MLLKRTYNFLFFALLGMCLWGQDVAYNDAETPSYSRAYALAFDGDTKSAKATLLAVLDTNPKNNEARALLASTYSWNGQYTKARQELNKITSVEKTNRGAWISAIKNELYAKNGATALGLANKALFYLSTDTEIERLREIALAHIKNQKYPQLSWLDTKTRIKKNKKGKVLSKTKSEPKKEKEAAKVDEKKPTAKEVLNNRVAIRNSFTVFDQRYDPMVFTSISFRRQTAAGSLIPRINYSNRNGQHGVQYDLDFYPKFSKRFYAYLNYGYSSSATYPNHKVGGDLYVNLPGAIEFSAGGRYISLDDRNVTMITNSLGHYRGNYYFSLRSNLSPKSDNLMRVSGNLLIRKYLKDADNYIGFNIGMGYSPELRQLLSGDELLAETLLYIESQRMSFQYQFTGKKNPNIYSASLGVSRQELSFDSGSFVWSVSAGLAYQVRF